MIEAMKTILTETMKTILHKTKINLSFESHQGIQIERTNEEAQKNSLKILKIYVILESKYNSDNTNSTFGFKVQL